MAAATFLQSVTYRDAKGQTAVVKFYVTSLTGSDPNARTAAGAVLTALAAGTNAAEQSAHGPANTGQLPVTFGSSGADYQDVPMKAVLTFASATGALHRYQLPAPIVAMFKADRQTVDPAATASAAIISAITATYVSGDAFVSSKDGSQIVSYSGGVYRASKGPRRKLNINVRDSSLTPGLPAI